MFTRIGMALAAVSLSVFPVVSEEFNPKLELEYKHEIRTVYAQACALGYPMPDQSLVDQEALDRVADVFETGEYGNCGTFFSTYVQPLDVYDAFSETFHNGGPLPAGSYLTQMEQSLPAVQIRTKLFLDWKGCSEEFPDVYQGLVGAVMQRAGVEDVKDIVWLALSYDTLIRRTVERNAFADEVCRHTMDAALAHIDNALAGMGLEPPRRVDGTTTGSVPGIGDFLAGPHTPPAQ